MLLRKLLSFASWSSPATSLVEEMSAEEIMMVPAASSPKLPSSTTKNLDTCLDPCQTNIQACWNTSNQAKATPKTHTQHDCEEEGSFSCCCCTNSLRNKQHMRRNDDDDEISTTSPYAQKDHEDTKPRHSKSRKSTTRFDPNIQTITFPRVRPEDWPFVFYDADEISEFRYQRWLEELDLPAGDF